MVLGFSYQNTLNDRYIDSQKLYNNHYNLIFQVQIKEYDKHKKSTLICFFLDYISFKLQYFLYIPFISEGCGKFQVIFDHMRQTILKF